MPGGVRIGGQFNMACRVPGKEEFTETLRYFRRRIELLPGIELRLNTRVDAPSMNVYGTFSVMGSTIPIRRRRPMKSRSPPAIR